MSFVPPHLRKQNRIAKRWVLSAAIASCLGMAGCAQRAYTELYVENMASEIRLLEDRVYEYDAEYRALENELDDLRAINESLEAKLREAEKVRSQPRTAPKPSTSPEPKSSAKEPLKLGPTETESLDVVVPDVIVPKKNVPTVPSSEALPPKTDAAPKNAPILPEGGLVPPPIGAKQISTLTAPKESSSTLSLELPKAPSGLPDPFNGESLKDRRIVAPSYSEVQRASANLPLNEPKPFVPPADQRPRQVEFHPSLCRGNNSDGKPGDDGIYLVMIPRNASGQFVPAVGKWTVVVEETVADQVRRIGRWEISPEEAQELLEPIGSGQGVHLKLDWQEAIPESQTIHVYVRFTDTHGTTMVNDRQVHLRKATPGQSTWTPR